jgi:hypothetical protein
MEWLNERESERGAGSGRQHTAKGVGFTSRLVNTPRVQRTSTSLREKEREARGDKPSVPRCFIDATDL